MTFPHHDADRQADDECQRCAELRAEIERLRRQRDLLAYHAPVKSPPYVIVCAPDGTVLGVVERVPATADQSQFDPAYRRLWPEEIGDRDTLITPARKSETVTVEFEQGERRPPSISDDPTV